MHYSSNVTADLDNNCHGSVVAARRYQIELGIARADSRGARADSRGAAMAGRDSTALYARLMLLALFRDVFASELG